MDLSASIQNLLAEMARYKQAEAKLVREREFFDALMKNFPDRIYFKDLASHFIRINEAQARVLGVSSPAHVQGKTDFDFFTEEHACAAYADEQRIVATGTPLIGKLEKVRNADGTFRWVTATKAPIRDAAGHITGTFGISRDVTEQKQLEDELEQIKDYLQTLLENASDIIYTLDRNGRFTFLNRRVEQVSDTPTAELIGRHFLTTVAPEDRQLLTERLRPLPLEQPHSFQVRLLATNHARIEAEVHTAPILKEGVFVATLGIARDMTERNALERTLRAERDRLDAILGSMAEGVIVADAHHQLQLVNPAAETLLGLPRHELLGRNLSALTLPITLDDMATSSAELPFRPGLPGQVRAWGSRMLDITVTALLDTTGNRIGTVSLLRDVTESIRIDQMKSEFISLVSHELRAPLTAIKGYTDLVVEGNVAPLEQQEFLGIIKTNVDHLVVMLNDLLDISRVEAGRIKLYPTLIPLTPMLGEIIRTLRPQFEAKGQKIYAHLPKGDVCVLADRDRLSQILWNLLTNAHKYSLDGAVIRVRVENTVADRYTACNPELIAQHTPLLAITVEDEGIGISAEDQTKLFTKFFRADNPYTRAVGGTGLGLAIVKSFVEMHGGHVWVVSPLNAEARTGARFTFTIPLIQDATLNPIP
ncbi:MAG: PAS domain S-box protein [Anaerolineae bacterium]